jgi:ABC-2 type transport system permease protein
MTRTFAIASNTLTDLTRQRVFHFILIFALVLIASSVFLARFSFQQELQILSDISLGAMSIFSSLLAILATARLIPQDIEDRIAYSILAKPVPRFAYVIGKLLGVVALLAISIVAMSALYLALLYVREHALISETTWQYANLPREELERALREVRETGFKIDIIKVIALLFFKAGVLAALTLLVTTFATTNIFTIMTMVFVYFIGHLQATARDYWLQQRGGAWLTQTLLALVALIFPDLQAFNRADDIVAGHALSLGVFGQTAALGGFYIVVYTALAIVMFGGKEL